MKIILTNEEKEEIFYNALCNSITGNIGYGLQIDYSEREYNISKNKLKNQNGQDVVCIEDVYMQMLRDGFSITWKDIEGNGEQTASILLQDIHNDEKWDKIPVTHILAYHTEDDDAWDADMIIQHLLYGEQIFA